MKRATIDRLVRDLRAHWPCSGFSFDMPPGESDVAVMVTQGTPGLATLRYSLDGGPPAVATSHKAGMSASTAIAALTRWSWRTRVPLCFVGGRPRELGDRSDAVRAMATAHAAVERERWDRLAERWSEATP